MVVGVRCFSSTSFCWAHPSLASRLVREAVILIVVVMLIDDYVLQIDRKNRLDKDYTLTLPDAVDVVKEAFITAGERDIYVGDAVEIFVITAAGITEERFELKKD